MSARECLDCRSKQQFVQTEVSYSPRAPSPVYTDEQLRLLAQANDLPPDAKPEELISRYSHLIEQSEANRLAETVKKVEKRMKVLVGKIKLRCCWWNFCTDTDDTFCYRTSRNKR